MNTIIHMFPEWSKSLFATHGGVLIVDSTFSALVFVTGRALSAIVIRSLYSTALCISMISGAGPFGRHHARSHWFHRRTTFAKQRTLGRINPSFQDLSTPAPCCFPGIKNRQGKFSRCIPGYVILSYTQTTLRDQSYAPP